MSTTGVYPIPLRCVQLDEYQLPGVYLLPGLWRVKQSFSFWQLRGPAYQENQCYE